jgi:hypothetical protein
MSVRLFSIAEADVLYLKKVQEAWSDSGLLRFSHAICRLAEGPFEVDFLQSIHYPWSIEGLLFDKIGWRIRSLLLLEA